MPRLPDTPGVVKVECLGTAESINIVNLFHLGYSGIAPTAPICADVASDVAASFEARFLPNMPAIYSLNKVVVTDLSSDTGASGEDDITGATGSAGANKLALSSCVVGSWQIARRYRGGKPRTYLSPVQNGILGADMYITAGSGATLQAAFAGFMADCNAIVRGGEVWTLGCVSYYLDKVLRAAGLFEPFLSVSVDKRLGHQRRRDGKLSPTRF